MSGYAPGSLRIWDGTAWRYPPSEWQTPTYESVKEGASSLLISTTTTCTKSATTIHSGSAITITGSTTGRNGGTLEFYYRVGAGAWALLASRAAPTAGGSVSVSHAPTADGTNYYVKFTGSTTHQSSSSAATSSMVVQTYKTVTTIIPVGWTQAYGGQNKKIIGSSRDSAMHQGFYSSTYGNRKSLMRFNPALPAGASVSRVIFDCNSGWTHWYHGTGTIILGAFHNQDTEPSTMDGVQIYPNRSRKAVGEGSFEVDITSWANTAMVNPSFSGILIGPGPSTSGEFNGYSILAPAGNFSLRVTYSHWS